MAKDHNNLRITAPRNLVKCRWCGAAVLLAEIIYVMIIFNFWSKSHFEGKAHVLFHINMHTEWIIYISCLIK